MAFNIFTEHAKEQHTNSSASYLLDGLMHLSKYQTDSNYRKLLDSFSKTFIQLEQQINAVGRETFPDETIALIERWERDLGIPDDIFDASGTVEERRSNVLLKLASLGAQTEEDFVFIADLIGFEVTLTPLSENALPPYSVPFIPTTLPEARFVVFVKGKFPQFPPYDVPFTPTADANSALIALFNKLKPANVKFIYFNDGF